MALVVALALTVSGGATAASAEELQTETRDWVFVAPSEIGTAADLELLARAIQICTDELRKLIGHRPANVATFEWRWLPGSTRGSGATSTGVLTWFTPGFTIADSVTRPFRESLVARRACFGPHEIAHVLTWQSWGQAWANEGFANFTDNVYDSAAWRCCATPPHSTLRCDSDGYTWALDRYAFTDLSPFTYNAATYNTAGCFWWEVHRLGGFPAIRAILASMRGEPPLTTGAFVIRHVNPILGVDLRPLLERMGFEPTELEAPARRMPPKLCTRIGTAGRDVLSGTRGRDVLCGLAGADLFRTWDRSADTISCGAGKDVVVADRRDRVARDCERVSRP